MEEGWLVDSFLLNYYFPFHGMFLFFQSSGKTPSFKIEWKINLNGSVRDLPQSLIIRLDVLSNPFALSTFKFFIIKLISSSVNVLLSNLSLVLNSKEGSLLLLTIGIHWEAKCELKSSAFSEKFETTSSLAILGGIFGIFLLCNNRFEIDL